MSFDLPGNDMIGLPRDVIVALRAHLFRQDSAAAASALYEAGFAGGGPLHDAFVRWCRSRRLPAPAEMAAAPDFAQHASTYFAELGLGALSVETINDAAIALDSANWAEAEPSAAMQFPGCYMSAGMLTEFFTRIGGTPLSVMEVECRSMGSARCRFIVASAETVQQVYDALTQGTSYEAALSGA